MVIQLIVLDTNNAKYLWKRLPGNFRNEKHQVQHKNLSAIWQVGKALTKKNYPEAFKLISTATVGQPDSVQKLLALLIRILREEHVLKSIQKAYSSIGYEEVKTLLGFSGPGGATD